MKYLTRLFKHGFLILNKGTKYSTHKNNIWVWWLMTSLILGFTFLETEKSVSEGQKTNGFKNKIKILFKVWLLYDAFKDF